MNLNRVLENWEEYEQRKLREPETFLMSEPWEVDFLLRKILLHFPYFEESRIRRAIMLCGTRLGDVVARHQLVECLMLRLGLVAPDTTNNADDNPKSI